MCRILALLPLLLMGRSVLAESPPVILWTRATELELRDVYETSEGTLIAAGRKGSSPDCCVFLYSSTGNLIWEYGVPGYDYFQRAEGVAVDPAGGFIATGRCRANSYTKYSLFLTRIDDAGEEVWSRFFSISDVNLIGYSVLPLPGGGYLVCGERDPSTGMDQAWTLRTDAEGDTLWTREWGWTYNDMARRAVYVDGGLTVLMQGSTQTTPGGPHLARYAMDGTLLWDTPITAQASLYGQDMCLASDGGFVITTDGVQATIVHVDWNGNLIWQSGIAGDGNSVAPTMDGGYIHAGDKEIIPYAAEPEDAWGTEAIDTEYYGLVTRFDQDGNLLWLDHVYDEDCMYLYAIRQLAQGGYIVAGSTTLGTGLLIRYASETGIEEGTLHPPRLMLDAPVPNPSTGSVGISFEVPFPMMVDLTVYDLSGRRVTSLVSGAVLAGPHQAAWDPGNAPSGCYLVVLRTEEETLTRTCVRI